MNHTHYSNPLNSLECNASVAEFLWLSIGHLSSRTQETIVYLFFQGPAGCVISDSSGPRLLRWVWGLQWPGLQARPHSGASLQMSHCSHQPSATITNVPSSQWPQRVTITVTAFTQSALASQIVTRCDIRKRYPDSDVTPLAPGPHRGSVGGGSGQWLQFLPDPWLNTRNCFLD